MPEELFKNVKLKHLDGPPGGWLRFEPFHLSRETKNSKLANLSFWKVIFIKIGHFVTQIFGKFLIFNHRIAMNHLVDFMFYVQKFYEHNMAAVIFFSCCMCRCIFSSIVASQNM